MRLVSYRTRGETSYGVMASDGAVVDLRMASPDAPPSLRQWLARNGLASLDRREPDRGAIGLHEVELLPVIPDPAHVWCLAINFEEHINEIKALGILRDKPAYPALFMRYADTLIAHHQPIVLPRVSTSLDWEGELAVIIGRSGRHIPPHRAMDYVAGYTCFNDVSVRDWQFHTRQIAPGKNFAGTGALGPWLVTKDSVADPRKLHITTRVNGEVMQRGSTADMIFDIPAFIAYVSAILPLRAGDVLATGTPSGVGFSRKPPVFLRAGDLCEVEITGVGKLLNRVAAEDPREH